MSVRKAIPTCAWTATVIDVAAADRQLLAGDNIRKVTWVGRLRILWFVLDGDGVQRDALRLEPLEALEKVIRIWNSPSADNGVDGRVTLTDRPEGGQDLGQY